jgi:hypothetical protein
VVGGGIAGASLAYALAKAGVDLLVLEASLAFEDRVRGESMPPQGVAEARELGVEDVLLATGAHVSPVWKPCVEDDAQPRDIPMSIMATGIGGGLNLCHADACQAILDAAAAAGAKVQRGLRDVKLAPGPPVTVDFRPHGKERFEGMRRLRLIADVLAVTEVEDGADNRSAGRAFAGQKAAELGPDCIPLIAGAFAGPETLPGELVDDAILDRIRSA